MKNSITVKELDKQDVEVMFPTFRRYNPTSDVDGVVKLLSKCGISVPQDRIIFAVVAVNSATKEIIGFTSLLVNHFIEPLAVEPTLPVSTRVKIIDAMLFMVGGVAVYLDIEKLYFVSEVNKVSFVNFIQRQFKVKEFAESKIFSVELK